ncbi:zinc finger protein 90-like [Lingula anatina]|uniref:Zinc finger protein 90-like n=1 Tax=Lingula anatina TaxID=7574 RepID=A0A2R2MQQ3_LINAN|nr:zinc finger protein 90-like [Lingula anatina]|eukprot:XP_023932576.1 zinc finger protein 90-like [Lingula anatina]
MSSQVDRLPLITELLTKTVRKWCQENLVFSSRLQIKGVINIHRDKELIVTTLDEVINKEDVEESEAPPSSPSGVLSSLSFSQGHLVFSTDQLQKVFRDALNHVVHTDTAEEDFESPRDNTPVSFHDKKDDGSMWADISKTHTSSDQKSIKGQRSRSVKSPPSKDGKIAKKHQCVLCRKQFRKKATLEKHIIVVHKGYGDSCDVGEESEKLTLREINTQSKCHGGKEQEVTKCVCDTCAEAFASLAALKVHMRCHETAGKMEAPLHCAVCNKTFEQDAALLQHRSSGECNQSETASFMCNLCGQEFKTQKTLNEHKQGMHGSRRYICQCGKEFRWRSSLRRHILFCPFLKMLAAGETSCGDLVSNEDGVTAGNLF